MGTVPPWLIGLLLGRTLVISLVTSFRIDGQRLRADLGWAPARPRLRDEIAATVALMP